MMLSSAAIATLCLLLSAPIAQAAPATTTAEEGNKLYHIEQTSTGPGNVNYWAVSTNDETDRHPCTPVPPAMSVLLCVNQQDDSIIPHDAIDYDSFGNDSSGSLDFAEDNSSGSNDVEAYFSAVEEEDTSSTSSSASADEEMSSSSSSEDSSVDTTEDQQEATISSEKKGMTTKCMVIAVFLGLLLLSGVAYLVRSRCCGKCRSANHDTCTDDCRESVSDASTDDDSAAKPERGDENV